MSYLYHIFIFNPLYNALIYLMDISPFIDAGVAVIILTIIVRLILFPLSKKAIVTQVRMKEIEPELNKIKRTVTDRQEQALKIMALYKDRQVNPFSSFLVLLIQLPIIIALYSIFIKSGLPVVQNNLLYSFVAVPDVNMQFLGIIDVGMKSIVLSFIAGVAQFLQLHYSLSSNINTTQTSPQSSTPSQIDIAQNMMKNMKYIFPVIAFIISYQISAVVAIYWAVSSLFTLGQELVVRRKLRLIKV